MFQSISADYNSVLRFFKETNYAAESRGVDESFGLGKGAYILILV